MPPNPPFLLDSTKLKAWMACPRRFQLGYLQHLEPAGATSVHLQFGKAVHAGLEILENELAAHFGIETALLDALEETRRLYPMDAYPDEPAKTTESIARVLVWYAEQFYRGEDGLETAPALRPVANEQPFCISLDALVQAGSIHEGHLRQAGFSSPAELPRVSICGRFDSLVEGPAAGEFSIRDRKTTTRSMTPWYFNQYQPNVQISLYTWIARQIWPKRHIKGVIIEGIQVGASYCRFIRKEFKPWPEVLEEFLVSMLIAIRQMDEAGIFNGPAPALLPPNEAACMSDGMPCSYRQLCSTHPRIRQEIIASAYRPREPWSPLDEAGLPTIETLGIE